MKNIINMMIIAIIILLGGCASKQISSIKQYDTFYTNETAKKTVYFSGVSNMVDGDIVTKIYSDNKVINTYKLAQNIEQWYKNGYKKEFEATEISLSSKLNNPKITHIAINIRKLDIKYYKFQITKNNLIGSLSLEIVFKKGNNIIKKVVNIQESKLKPLASDASSFEEFIYKFLSHSIVKATKIIIDTLKTI